MQQLTFIPALILICAITATAHATDAAIGGYSPVAYFTEGQALKGLEEFSVVHKGKHYFLRNTTEVELFKSSPDKFVPRYELCPYSLALGQTLPIDPTNFQIIGGHLLLFHKSENMDGLASFQSSELSDEELLERADKQFTLLRF